MLIDSAIRDRGIPGANASRLGVIFLAGVPTLTLTWATWLGQVREIACDVAANAGRSLPVSSSCLAPARRVVSSGTDAKGTPVLTRFYTFFFRWLGPFIGAYFVYVSVAAWSNSRALEESGTTVQARVVEDDGPTTRWNSVRYAFDVGGATYSYTDDQGRHDAWANLTGPAYERARAERVVAVRFDPANPWNNEPLELVAADVVGRITSVVLGLACMIPGLISWIAFALGARHGWRKRTSEASAGGSPDDGSGSGPAAPLG